MGRHKDHGQRSKHLQAKRVDRKKSSRVMETGGQVTKKGAWRARRDQVPESQADHGSTWRKHEPWLASLGTSLCCSGA